MTKVGTLGVFDYEIHQGHIEFLKYARSNGDFLIVFVVDDNTATRIKRKPYYSQTIRALNLMQYADQVFVTTENNEFQNIISHDLDIWVFGPDQRRKFDKELEKILRDTGVQIVHAPPNLKMHSTSELLRKIGFLD